MVDICFESSAVEVERVVTGPLDNNVYFVRCKATDKSTIIDAPGGDAGLLVEICTKRAITMALITHGHQDHVGAVRRLRSAGVHVGVGEEDVEMSPEPDFTIGDGDVFKVGALKIAAISTPGHTPGSTCFTIEGERVLFSGDTLFPGGPGATRWPYSDFDQIIGSISSNIFARFDDDTVVLPGHGNSTTVGTERPQLADWIARRW